MCMLEEKLWIMILKYVVSFDYLFEMKIEIYVLLQIDINQAEQGLRIMQWLCYDFKCTIIVSVWLIEKFWCMEKTHTSQHGV